MDSRRKTLRIIMFLIAVLLVYRLIKDDQDKEVLNEVNGTTMGTINYTVKYFAKKDLDLKPQIDSLLVSFNKSLSTYDPNSEISRFNSMDTLAFESPFFYPVLQTGLQVYRSTDGAFDPTVGPLVDAWGFGPDKNRPLPSQETIQELLTYVGFDKVAFDPYYIAKSPGVRLDFSAIAKGYAVDLVGKLLEKKDIQHYMVEIGGEVITSGKNEEEFWKIGVEDPMVGPTEQRLLGIVKLENKAIATSGNYRNYIEKNGRIYAHIINPRTGYTSEHNLLSASLFSSTCMKADAYATACMVMGFDESKALVERTDDLDAVFLYLNDNGELKSYATAGIAPYFSLTTAEAESN